MITSNISERMIKMSSNDEMIVAPLVLAYYEWLSGNGGTDPETLFANELTEEQRILLKQGIDDVNVIWGITAPLRQASALEELEETFEEKTSGYILTE